MGTSIHNPYILTLTLTKSEQMVYPHINLRDQSLPRFKESGYVVLAFFLAVTLCFAEGKGK